MQIARRATFAFFGILNGTEYNPEFVAEVQAAVPRKGSPVVLYCAIGGTLMEGELVSLRGAATPQRFSAAVTLS